MNSRLNTILVVLFLMQYVFFSCKSDNVTVDSVRVYPSSVVLTVGSSFSLSAVVLPWDANQNPVWSSSNPSIAMVNSTGLVKAVSCGECIITLQANYKRDMCHITVVNDYPINPYDTILPNTVGFDSIGASFATFSIASGNTVRFSRGNLQYQASTDTWRFAEHQYDYIGDANRNASENYPGWIDLFGWGTSGWNSGQSTCYQPWSTSTVHNDYYPGSSSTNTLTGVCANADWGVYNQISNGGNQVGMWRTLTKGEWEYMFNHRNNAAEKRGVATVNGISGLVLLPDNWALPNGLSFNCGIGDYHTNIYTVDQWSQMESAGAVFLPAAGYRYSGVYGAGIGGLYWLSTYSYHCYAYYINFVNYDISSTSDNRAYGLSVRLVRDKYNRPN